MSSSPASSAPARPARSCCGPTRVLVASDVRPARSGRLAVLDRRSPATGRPGGDRAIDETEWTTLEDYPPTSIAQIAETTLGERRLIVRRVRTLDRQGELLPSWELFPFVTNRNEPLALVEAEHRQHAVVELCIRDLKDQALAHFPSGKFAANGAWTVIGCLAHNLLRWTGVLGLPGQTVRAARTVRRQLLATARPADPHRAALDASPARPLALAARVPQSAGAHPSARSRCLTRPKLAEAQSTHPATTATIQRGIADAENVSAGTPTTPPRPRRGPIIARRASRHRRRTIHTPANRRIGGSRLSRRCGPRR